MDAQDDLLDDLMNIVQNDENPKTAASQPDQVKESHNLLHICFIGPPGY